MQEVKEFEMKKVLIFVVSVLSSTSLFAYGRFSPIGISINCSQGANGRDSSDAQFPSSDDNVYGWRLAFICGAHRNMVGLASGIIANDDGSMDGYVGGLQACALFNTAGTGELGVWQLSGFYNKVENSANGFQACAFFNEVSRGYFNGLQIAMANVANATLCGMQLGLYNDCDSTWGMQIGLVNRSQSLAGVQLGVLNFVQSSKMAMFPIVRIGW